MFCSGCYQYELVKFELVIRLNSVNSDASEYDETKITAVNYRWRAMAELAQFVRQS